MIFISYSHDSPAHQDRILALSKRPRAQGIDCRIDQYEQSPSEGWPTWCDKSIEHSTFFRQQDTPFVPLTLQSATMKPSHSTSVRSRAAKKPSDLTIPT